MLDTESFSLSLPRNARSFVEKADVRGLLTLEHTHTHMILYIIISYSEKQQESFMVRRAQDEIRKCISLVFYSYIHPYKYCYSYYYCALLQNRGINLNNRYYNSNCACCSREERYRRFSMSEVSAYLLYYTNLNILF